jgi:CRP-like cAMP-binding protein
MSGAARHDDELTAVLATTPLFRHLTARQRARLAVRFCRRRYGAGDVIVRQGDTSMSLYVVISGRVSVSRCVGGDVVTIVEDGPGCLFGEMGLLDDAPRAATVVAVEPTDCALLSKWEFHRLVAADPTLARALISLLTTRIRTLNDRLSLSPTATPRPEED